MGKAVKTARKYLSKFFASYINKNKDNGATRFVVQNIVVLSLR